MVRAALSTALAAALVMCATAVPAQQQLVEVPVSAAFSKSELSWDTNGGKINFAWAVLDFGGVAHVCGATSATSNFAQRNPRMAFRKAWVKLSGK